MSIDLEKIKEMRQHNPKDEFISETRDIIRVVDQLLAKRGLNETDLKSKSIEGDISSKEFNEKMHEINSIKKVGFELIVEKLGGNYGKTN